MNRTPRNVMAYAMMILVVLVAGWLFYGLPVNKSHPSNNGQKEEQTSEMPADSADSAMTQPAGTEPEADALAAKDGQTPGNAESPYLLDHLPFKEEDVTGITAKSDSGSVQVPAERQAVLLQSLRFTDMQGAVVKENPGAERKPVILQFTLNDSSYELTYDLALNAFQYDGHAYYADDQVLLLMQGLFRENKDLATLDALLEQARVEQEQAGAAEPEALEASRAEVEGLDFNGWEQRLAGEQAENVLWEKPFYDDSTGRVKQARLFKDGVLALNRIIVFTTADHQTADGVKVGIGAGNVMDKLGPKALRLVSRWSYKVGDYYRFHVYFQDQKVKYIVLSQPL
ncbi:hypothetical protein EHV15_09415 [Paenibacillus oralis]|uniref:Uncharacterized protein n=1 Tax=Paenibacillus oralis TaxID=2490856 RepID=A0A3P3TYD6_9BACL|nr:hypothetical protein [Paenibacillus oralis]RRJ63121.1 hypothetical protein EHV15_09415 [Paenibacillus oralis]